VTLAAGVCPVSPLTDIRAVLFDLDGTLIDSAPDLGGAADTMRLARGMPSMPLSHYRRLAGAGARGMLQVALGITPEHPDFLTLREEFFCNYAQRLTANTVVFDQVPELIDSLVQRGLRWGVVTNKSMRFTDPLTRTMPLFASASTIVSGDTTAHSKPHPAPLLEAARQLELPPGQCLYVGDDERDVIAGRAAGMRTVAVNYGYLGVNADTAQWGADIRVNSALAILKYIAAP